MEHIKEEQQKICILLAMVGVAVLVMWAGTKVNANSSTKDYTLQAFDQEVEAMETVNYRMNSDIDSVTESNYESLINQYESYISENDFESVETFIQNSYLLVNVTEMTSQEGIAIEGCEYQLSEVFTQMLAYYKADLDTNADSSRTAYYDLLNSIAENAETIICYNFPNDDTAGNTVDVTVTAAGENAYEAAIKSYSVKPSEIPSFSVYYENDDLILYPYSSEIIECK